LADGHYDFHFNCRVRREAPEPPQADCYRRSLCVLIRAGRAKECFMLVITGKPLRLARLSRPGDGRFLFIPFDHSVSDGPIASVTGFPKLVQDVTAGGADGTGVPTGRARVIPPNLLRQCALVVHLSASTAHAPDANAKVLVGDVEEALRIGADAVSVHVNIGSDTEPAQLEDLGAVA